IHMPVALILNLLTFTSLGVQRLEYVDDRAWLRFPVIGTFQPSEILKLSFILTFALHLSLVSKKINKPKVLIPVCIHGAIPVILIHLQGDDGTAIIFAVIFAFMLFKSGLSYKYIGAGIGAVAVMVPILWFFILSDDKKDRIFAVYSPQNSSKAILWQQNMGKIAIGSGGVSGKGLGSQSYQLVPENHNDFIFSFIGEAFGFLGCMLMIILICTISFRIIYTLNIADDEIGQNICVGVFAMLIGQSVINIGMNLSLIPVIGITLPLMSAGGSSVIVTYIGIGMVLSVYQRARGNMFLE
ncbi:MAG: FtsW/RodA/SpoVE family cell cycle protein, partial [Oscillospiraceae bacterium]